MFTNVSIQRHQDEAMMGILTPEEEEKTFHLQRREITRSKSELGALKYNCFGSEKKIIECELILIKAC